MRQFQLKGDAVANSFRSRYETWLAVHALLLYQETEAQEVEVDEAVQAEMHRQERCRHATIAAMVASQEVKTGSVEGEEEEDLAA